MIGVQLNGYRYQKAVVGFGGRQTLWWMRFLKKGFYHCIIALGNDDEWVVIDPLLHFTDMIVLKKRYYSTKIYKTRKTELQFDFLAKTTVL